MPTPNIGVSGEQKRCCGGPTLLLPAAVLADTELTRMIRLSQKKGENNRSPPRVVPVCLPMSAQTYKHAHAQTLFGPVVFKRHIKNNRASIAVLFGLVELHMIRGDSVIVVVTSIKLTKICKWFNKRFFFCIHARACTLLTLWIKAPSDCPIWLAKCDRLSGRVTRA